MRIAFLNSHSLINAFWPDVELLIDPVIDHAAHGEFETSDLRALCEDNRAYCIVVIDGEAVVLAMIFEIVNYPRICACNIIAIGGINLVKIAGEFFVTFKKFCKDIGVTVIEASCSSVMARLLRRIGLVKTYEVVRCDTNIVNTPMGRRVTKL